VEESFEAARPARAFVDLDRIEHNVAYLKGLLPPGCRFMAVVKADAYGHGDLEVSKAAVAAGADCLGVALVEEAERLRAGGVKSPLQLLFEPPPGTAVRAHSCDMTFNVYTLEFARALSEAAAASGRPAVVHIKVDTGMRRVGIYPEDVRGFASSLLELPGLELEGICTHFAVATEPENPFTATQMERFEGAAAEAEDVAGRVLVRHAANSAGVLAFPRSHYDMVRVGIAMLGLPPSEHFADDRELRPAMSLTGDVAFVKRVGPGEGISYGLTYAPASSAYIATLPLGYADGVSRIQSGKAEVLIRGRRRPVVGTICMDLCMVDMGDERVQAGEPFTVIGRDGEEEITMEEVAGRLGTINYEVACMISARVPRVYVRGRERE
jgi:alanine racemase